MRILRLAWGKLEVGRRATMIGLAMIEFLNWEIWFGLGLDHGSLLCLQVILVSYRLGTMVLLEF